MKLVYSIVEFCYQVLNQNKVGILHKTLIILPRVKPVSLSHYLFESRENVKGDFSSSRP